jgi:hypothetical protein
MRKLVSQNTTLRRFDLKAVQALADELAEVTTAQGGTLTSVEMAYAVAAVLRGLGEATYDKESTDYDDVLKDYRVSPSWSAALILHADQIHKIYELFTQEIIDPDVNKQAWKAHEEQLNVNE